MAAMPGLERIQMAPIGVLPECAIHPGSGVRDAFLQRGAATFHAACQLVKDLPYGSNSNWEQPLALLEDNRGTCFTKHGVIARLARELGLSVHKNLGFYRLCDEIVTGVSQFIEPHSVSFVPQIHCFLEFGPYHVDLTEGNAHGKNKTIDTYDFIVRVEPRSEERRVGKECGCRRRRCNV